MHNNWNIIFCIFLEDIMQALEINCIDYKLIM